MSYYSEIEWTDTTWNPVTGCTKVSKGCDHCYAERIAERFRETPRQTNSGLNSEGAVTIRAFIWLTAWVRALMAESLTIFSIRIISTLSRPDLGWSLATPARTERAAISASTGSLFPALRRVDLSGRFSSMTVWPSPARYLVSPAP